MANSLYAPAVLPLSSVVAGAVAGLVAALYAVCFAHLVFAGPLAPAAPLGLAMALTGTAVAAVAAALPLGRPEAIWQVQGPVVVVLAAAMRQLAAGPLVAAPDRLVATAVAAVALVAVLTGGAMLVLGRLRLARIAKSLPYPVVGGFLAATGLYLVLSAMRFAVAGEAGGAATGGTAATLLAPGALGGWALPVGLALAMTLARRWLSSAVAMAIGVVAVLVLSGPLGLAAAMPATGPALPQPLILPVTLTPGLAAAVDPGALKALLPLLLTAVALGVLGLLLNLSAIDIGGDRPMDLDAELRAAGAANLVAGLLGGFPAYHSATLTGLARSVAPRLRWLAPLSAAVAVLGLAAFGTGLLERLPPALFALLLAYLGFDFLRRWLVFERRRMPRGDYLIVWLILAVAVAKGFVVAIGAGIVVASLRFTLAYARVDAVLSRTTGAERLSSIERSEQAGRALAAAGAGTVIYELQGYMFFGTADALFERIRAELAASATGLRNLVVDFARVDGMDVSAVLMIGRLAGMARGGGARVHFTALSPDLGRLVARSGAGDGVRFHPTLDDALIEVEDGILAGAVGDDTAAVDVRALVARLADAAGAAMLVRAAVAAGTVVFEAGAPSEDFIVLEAGRMEAVVGPQERRVATFLPGAVVGEIGLLTGGPRSARVIAREPSRIIRVTAADLTRLKAQDPALALELAEALAGLVARRLARTTALAHAVRG